MSDVATPAADPVAATPTNSPVAETVTLSKEQHAQLVRDAARAGSAQSELDRIKNAGKRGKARLAPRPDPVAPTKEESDEEDRKAERGMLGLAVDPAFREVLDADPTLRNLLVSNPLGLLPAMAPDALDAEDAIGLVREELTKRAAAIKKVAPVKVEEPVEPDAPTAPGAGAVNVDPKILDQSYETAKKDPNTERAVASMIKVGLQRKRQGKS